MKPKGSLTALSAGVALVVLSMCSTSGHMGMNVVASQTFARMVQHRKTIQPIGNSGHAYIHQHEQFDAPVIRTADMVENAVPDAFWIDFHEGFDDRAKVEALIARHPDMQLRHEFWDAMNSITVQFTDIAALKTILDEIPGVKMVEPVIIHERPETAVPYQILSAKDLQHLAKSDDKDAPFTIHDYTGVAEIHKTRHLYGEGIKVGVVDSGVDYHHPALGGCFGPGCKVAYGYDFVGDDGRSPDNDPSSDCDGHGTHVAGIIAANDTMFLGVAPRATLGAYRVFSCKGGTTNDLIMLAMLRAVQDGMNVINLSLGGPGGWRQDREAALASKIANNGTLIVAAMGNEGRMGAFQASSPGVGESLLTVASTENEFKASRYFTVRDGAASGSPGNKKQHTTTPSKREDGDESNVDDGDEVIQPELKVDQGPSEERDILYTGDVDMDLEHNTLVQITPGLSPKVEGDACTPISIDLAGKIALVRRGDCTFVQKARNVLNAGGAGVIFMDNVPSNGFSADTRGVNIKSRTITMDDGVYLLGEIARQKKQQEGIWLKEGDSIKKVHNPDGGFLSDFTSMGPDAQLFAKPDIAGPGGGIWSTFPLKMGAYALESGTSMATPYIVGCVAMYLSANKDGKHTAQSIKTVFQNSAQPRMTQRKDRIEGISSVIRQGAGLVDMITVLDSKITVTPSYLSLNDTVRFQHQHEVSLTNTGSHTMIYKPKIAPAVGVLPFTANMKVDTEPSMIKADAMATFSNDTIKLAPGETKSVVVTFMAPDTPSSNYTLYSGYVEFIPEKSSSTYPTVRVPFMGMKGDFKQVNVLDPSIGVKLVQHGRVLHGPHHRAEGDIGTANAGEEGEDEDSAVETSTSSETLINALGNISNEVGNLPIPNFHDTISPPSDGHGAPPTDVGDARGGGGNLGAPSSSRSRSSYKDIMVVFRMVVASELMVVDLVSSEGSDPRTVHSYGVIRNGVAKYIPRNDELESNIYQVVVWRGEILDENGGIIAVPPSTIGEFRLRVSVLKPFGVIENDEDFESHLSVPFRLS